MSTPEVAKLLEICATSGIFSMDFLHVFQSIHIFLKRSTWMTGVFLMFFFVAMKKCVVPNAGIFAFANRMENVTMFVKQR